MSAASLFEKSAIKGMRAKDPHVLGVPFLSKVAALYVLAEPPSRKSPGRWQRVDDVVGACYISERDVAPHFQLSITRKAAVTDYVKPLLAGMRIERIDSFVYVDSPEAKAGDAQSMHDGSQTIAIWFFEEGDAEKAIAALATAQASLAIIDANRSRSSSSVGAGGPYGAGAPYGAAASYFSGTQFVYGADGLAHGTVSSKHPSAGPAGAAAGGAGAAGGVLGLTPVKGALGEDPESLPSPVVSKLFASGGGSSRVGAGAGAGAGAGTGATGAQPLHTSEGAFKAALTAALGRPQALAALYAAYQRSPQVFDRALGT